jgi:lactoylglutathione lyase
METTEFDPKLWTWGTEETKPRILHTMIRVKDFDAALLFYVEGLGMQVLRHFDVPVRRITAIFLGYGDVSDGRCLEVVRSWDTQGPHTHGSGYGHVAIGVPDVSGTLSRLEAMGAEVTLRPTVLVSGAPCIAFVKDPDGYTVELIQTKRN